MQVAALRQWMQVAAARQWMQVIAPKRPAWRSGRMSAILERPCVSLISPRQHEGHVSAWYFSHAGWIYCRSQFGYLTRMQAELAIEGQGDPGRLAIAIAGVNEAGHESGFPGIAPTDSLPWVQDGPPWNAWTTWRGNAGQAIVYRDVIVLDTDNHPVAVYNLTLHGLAIPANYEALKTILREAATP